MLVLHRIRGKCRRRQPARCVARAVAGVLGQGADISGNLYRGVGGDFFLAHIPESRYRALLWFDAAGLALFCVVGADRALEAGAGPFIAVAMGVASATFGGVIRDILGGESPLILRKEIYVTAALAGALAYVSLAVLGAPEAAATGIGFALCFTIRALALHYGWSLPVYRARAGRTVEEVEKMRE